MTFGKTILYFCFTVVVCIRPRTHIRRLSTVPDDAVIISSPRYALQPADPIGIVRDVKNRLDCTLLCSRHEHCRSASYILTSKLCLLSRSVLKAYEIDNWDQSLLPSVYTELKDVDVLKHSTKRLPAGPIPYICGTNVFADVSLWKHRQKRIVDGWTPEPYQASWVGLMAKNGRFHCTVFLISKEAADRTSSWALSARHCFVDDAMEDEDYNNSKETVSWIVTHCVILFNDMSNPRPTASIVYYFGLKRPVDLKPFSFLFGVHDLRVTTQHSIYRTASEIFLPPDEGITRKDIALIKLNKLVRFNSYINGLCLPDTREEFRYFHDTSCMTCGFGATKIDAKPVIGSNTLQCIKVEINVNDMDGIFLSDWNSVVRFRAATFGPYHGDSGSPIFCYSGNLWSYLFAIITGGQRLVFKNTRITAARIAYYMEFINKNLKRDVMCCPSWNKLG